MNSDKVLYSLACAAKGERVKHVCSNARVAQAAYDDVKELVARGVLNGGISCYDNRRRIKFPGDGYVEFHGMDAHWEVGILGLKTVVYDEASDHAAAAMRGSAP